MTDITPISAELEALQRAGHLRMQRTPSGTAVTADDWERFLPGISPQSLYRRFARVAGEGNEVKLDITFDIYRQETTLKFIHNGTFKDAWDYFTLKLNKTPVAWLDDANLGIGNRGKSIAKSYMREIAAFAKETGRTQMDMHAANVGAYAWAKCGFLPTTDEDWNSLRNHLRESISSDGTHIYSATTSYPITPDEQEAISHILALDSREGLRHLLQLNRVVDMKDGQPLTVSKALLFFEHYLATLPLEDGNPSYEIFKSYTGGRAHIQEMSR